MPEIIGAALVVLVGILVLWWARASRRGTLRRQWVLGYRTALTLSDRQAWITVHRAMAPSLFVAGAGLILGGLVAAVLALTHARAAVPVLLGIAIVWLLLWAIVSLFPAAAAARAYKRRSGSE